MSNERGIAGQATVTGHEIERRRFALRRCARRRGGAAGAVDHVAGRTDRAAPDHLHQHRTGGRRVRQLDAEAQREAGGPVLVFAGGSNLVIADTLTDLTAVRLANDGITVDGNLVRAEAGAVWDDVVVAAIEHGLGGLECLSGIPGSAGATPVQNVGAYGAEVSDTITRVRLLDRAAATVRWVPGGELGFGYRTSVFKQADGLEIPSVVLEVEFALDASGRSAPLRYGELTAALDAGQRRARRPASRPRGGAGAARPQGHGARRGRPRHLERRVRSSPTRWSHPTSTSGWPPTIDGPMPHYPAPDGVKLAAGWLVERAGFGKGYPDPDSSGVCALPAVHQARAGADQPRRRPAPKT